MLRVNKNLRAFYAVIHFINKNDNKKSNQLNIFD